MIGWYLHHHGRGHLHRLRAIAPHLQEPIAVFSSLAKPTMREAPELHTVTWVKLPDDWRGIEGDPVLSSDARANGALHWAPMHHPGHRERMREIAAWADRLSCMVVDVSAEVVMLARLLGLPTVAMTQPGNRTDSPHRAALGMATAVIAPFIAPRPGEASDGLLDLGSRVTFTGGISLLDGVVSSGALPGRAATNTRITLIGARGGFALTAEDAREAAAATAHLGTTWRVLGLEGGEWSNDMATELRNTDLVVIGAGLGSVADAAAARIPAIIVPQPRPFGEQVATGEMLTRLGLTVAEAPQRRWPEFVTRALAAGGERWDAWHVQGAAARAAQVITRVTKRWPVAQERKAGML